MWQWLGFSWRLKEKGHRAGQPGRAPSPTENGQLWKFLGMTAPPNLYTLSWPTGGGHEPLGVKFYKGAPWLGKALSQATKHSMAQLP